MPRFTELIDKIGRNEPLSGAELADLRRQGEAIDEVVSLVKSWITTGTSAPFIQNLRAENIFVPSGEIRLGTPAPGQGFSGVRIAQPPFEYNNEEWNIAGVNDDELQVGIRASDGKLIAGGGNVALDELGVLFSNNQQSALSFEDTSGGTDTIAIYSSGLDALTLGNAVGAAGAGIVLNVDTTNHAVITAELQEDVSLAGRGIFSILPTAKGARLNVGNEIFFDGEGASGGQTAISMYPSSVTPATPASNQEAQIYLKANKLIIGYNDGGTVRYKYLDLTGTGTTWTHTTSAP